MEELLEKLSAQELLDVKGGFNDKEVVVAPTNNGTGCDCGTAPVNNGTGCNCGK